MLKYQSVGLKQKVNNVADDLDAQFQFEAIDHEIIDMRQHDRQHHMTAVYHNTQTSIVCLTDAQAMSHLSVHFLTISRINSHTATSTSVLADILH